MQDSARQFSCDTVGRRIEVVIGEHVHCNAPVWGKACSNGAAGQRIKLFAERKTWSSDIDGDPVELSCVLEQKLAKIRHDATQPGRQSEEFARDNETDGIVIDDRDALALAE